jgi:hypothetical protein
VNKASVPISLQCVRVQMYAAKCERVYTSERPGDKLSRRAADESASFFSAIKCLRVHHMQCAFLNCCRGKLFNCAAGHAENCSSSASVRHGRTTRGILAVFRYSSHTYTHGGGCETKRWEFRDAAVWCCKWFQLLFCLLPVRHFSSGNDAELLFFMPEN